MHADTFKVLLYKNKINDLSLVDIADRLSKKSMIGILDDIGISIESDNVESTSNVYVFTDGNCKRNGKSSAKAGYGVYFYDEALYHLNYVEQLKESVHTNQKAELTAMLQLFKTINLHATSLKGKSIIICTDSSYSINCLTKWWGAWEKNNYKTAKGEPVKNVDLIKQIREEMKKCVIKYAFKHVMSHTKEPIDKTSKQYMLWHGNFIVDELINNLLTTK
jgi:ribonuclease HI